MFIKPLIAVLSLGLYLCPILAAADDMKVCNAFQQGNCERFCQAHQGLNRASLISLKEVVLVLVLMEHHTLNNKLRLTGREWRRPLSYFTIKALVV